MAAVARRMPMAPIHDVWKDGNAKAKSCALRPFRLLDGGAD
jgi:hypothetical protein